MKTCIWELNHIVACAQLYLPPSFSLQLSDINNYLTRLIFKLLPKSHISLISWKKVYVHCISWNIILVQCQNQDLVTTLHRKVFCLFFHSWMTLCATSISQQAVKHSHDPGDRLDVCGTESCTRFQQRLHSSGKLSSKSLSAQRTALYTRQHRFWKESIKTQWHFHATCEPTGQHPGFQGSFLSLAQRCSQPGLSSI